jgi:hypothetical protein
MAERRAFPAVVAAGPRAHALGRVQSTDYADLFERNLCNLCMVLL